jgi:precorrin-6B methylase 2
MLQPNYSELISKDIERCIELGFKFGHDWFHAGIKYDISEHITLKPTHETHILEIGAFEGKSTAWFIENFLLHEKSNIVVIDPYLCSDPTTPVDEKTFHTFQHNLSKSVYPDKVIFYKSKSEQILPGLCDKKSEYDIIFIDGSHLRRDIIVDIILSWKMLKVNGYLILDDYNNSEQAVRSCVQFYLSCLESTEYKLLHDKYVAVFQKLK